MRVTLCSGGIGDGVHRDDYLNAIRDLFGGGASLVFIPHASHNHDQYLRTMRERDLFAGLDFTGLHEHADPVRAIQQADGIYAGGGNSFLLVKCLHELGIIDAVRERVRAGVPYMGVSAGSNVACPTMMTTNDMPIVYPPSFDSFALVPFQINAHYHPGKIHFKIDDDLHDHRGESRDQRISEYHAWHDLPVVGLYEGAILRWDGLSARLESNRARLFRKGEEPVEFAPGETLPLEVCA